MSEETFLREDKSKMRVGIMHDALSLGKVRVIRAMSDILEISLQEAKVMCDNSLENDCIVDYNSDIWGKLRNNDYFNPSYPYERVPVEEATEEEVEECYLYDEARRRRLEKVRNSLSIEDREIIERIHTLIGQLSEDGADYFLSQFSSGPCAC